MNKNCLTKLLDCYNFQANDLKILFPSIKEDFVNESAYISKKLTTQVWIGTYKKSSLAEFINDEKQKSAKRIIKTGESTRIRNIREIKLPNTSSKYRRIIDFNESSEFDSSSVLKGGRGRDDVGLVIEKRQRMPLVKGKDFSIIIK